MEGQIVDIGTVAAQNLARALNLPDDKVPAVKAAIADEINAMSSHFTLAFADIQTAHEIAERQLKSTYRYASEHLWSLVGTYVAVFVIGAIAGLFLK